MDIYATRTEMVIRAVLPGCQGLLGQSCGNVGLEPHETTSAVDARIGFLVGDGPGYCPAGIAGALAAQRRAGQGGGYRLPALRYNATLAQAAKGHALDMGRHGFMSHYFPGLGPRVRVHCACRSHLQGPKQRSCTCSALVASVHCRAIMNPHYTGLGAGLSQLGNAWAVVLAQPR